MKATEAFPSKYISAADLQGRDVVVKITHVSSDEIGGKQKYICYFAGKQKGLVLNKTNWNNIVRISGQEDTDDWTGVNVCLFEAMVDFQGESVPAVRIKAPPKPNGNNITTNPQRITGGISDTQLDDDSHDRVPQPPMRRGDPDDTIPF